MMKILALAAAALPVASAVNILVYSDNACNSANPVAVVAYGGVCTSSVLFRMLGATCSSDTSVQLTAFNSATVCSGASAFSGQITTACTPIGTSIPGFGSAKIVNGTCAPGGPVYNAALYTDAACSAASPMGPQSFPLVANGMCAYYSWQSSVASTTTASSTSLSVNIASAPTSCATTIYNPSLTINGCTDLSSLTGSPASVKVAPAAAYNGAATLAASLAAVIVAAFVSVASAW